VKSAGANHTGLPSSASVFNHENSIITIETHGGFEDELTKGEQVVFVQLEFFQSRSDGENFLEIFKHTML
jgi:hypothetical protein